MGQAARRSLKKSLEADVGMAPEIPRSDVLDPSRDNVYLSLNRYHDYDSVEPSPANIKKSQTSHAGNSLYIIAVSKSN